MRCNVRTYNFLQFFFQSKHKSTAWKRQLILFLDVFCVLRLFWQRKTAKSYSQFLSGNSQYFGADNLWKGGGQNLERPNVERPIFRKFETSNVQITKVELLDFYCFQIYLLYLRLFEMFEHLKYMIIYHQIWNSWSFDSFTNCQIWEIFGIFFQSGKPWFDY